MISNNPLQSISALSQLLGAQQPTQTSAIQPAQASSSQTSGNDSLSPLGRYLDLR